MINKKYLSDYPELIKEWDYEQNQGLDPSTILRMSRYKANWICSKCGRKWTATIAHRVQGSGCPDCKKDRISKSLRNASIKRNGSLLEKCPDLCLEWHPTKNVGKKPSDYSPGSIESVYWLCSLCGNVWEAPIYRRARRHSGCPQCASERSTSFPEQAICFYLSQTTETINRYVENKKEIDIFLPLLKAGVEYDGLAYHKDDDGKVKDGYFKEKGIKIIHVKEIKSGQESKILDDLVLYSYKNSDYSNIGVAVKLVFQLLGLPSIDIDIEKDRNKIRENYITLRKKNSIISKRPELEKEWDYERNGKIRPEFISYSSASICSWICPKGHRYKARVYNRYKGTGCNICENKVLSIGDNDLLTKYPNLAKEWIPELNDGLLSSKVIAGGHKSWNWECPKCSHVYSAPILKRAKGSGCPYCSNHKLFKGYNDIAQRYPELVKEWHPTLNGDLKPEDVIDGSERIVWWLCPICNKPYQARVCNRIRGTACKRCKGLLISKKAKERSIKKSGSFAEKCPQLLLEWDYDKNAGIDPFKISPGSSQIVGWICKNCGNKWNARINHRVEGSNCRICSINISGQKHKKKVLLVETGQVFDGIVDAARWLGVSDTKALSQCLNGKKELYRGYHWQFIK